MKILQMYLIVLLSILYSVNSAIYKRDTGYPITTTSSLYNNYNAKTYGNDIASFPSNRYSNYNPLYPTNSYPYRSSSYRPEYSTQSYSGSYDQGYNSYESPFIKDISSYCSNRSPQVGISVESLMGMWYGVEVVQHLASDSSVDYARTCIVIHLSEPKSWPSTEHQLFHVQHINAKFRQEYRHLRLLWDEAGHNIEYALYFRNDSAGYWQVLDSQNGTLPKRQNYQQFGGSVQVLKAVNDHLVLNFCQQGSSTRPAQFYSVLFSRDPGFMARWEVEAVHNLLQNKKLSIASRRMVCGNSAPTSVYSLILIITCLLTYFTSSY